jgi:hypothetical protein
MGEMRIACKILFGKLNGRDRCDDRGVDDRIVLKWISRK